VLVVSLRMGGASIPEVCPTCGHGIKYGQFCSNSFHCCRACVWEAGIRTIICQDCAAEGVTPYILKLAALIISYEMDLPHVESPDCEDPSTYYGDIKPTQVEEWMKEKHHGDCVKQAITCTRCVADRAYHYADFILRRWTKQ
jgi:hypothetical protein